MSSSQERTRRAMSSSQDGPADLEALFAKLNQLHFSGSLQADLAWSGRMRVIAGNCDWQRRLIRLSRAYHEQHPDEIEATLLHEMLHLALRRGHDAVFRQAAARLGAPMRAGGRAVHREHKYVYACPGCGMRVKRRRKGVWACAACSGGVYDPRYRLRIVEFL